MFKNQANGRKNLLGIKMREIRKARGISQRQVADDLAELGLVVDKNAVQRMESGQRFITDIELITISRYPGKRAARVPYKVIFVISPV